MIDRRCIYMIFNAKKLNRRIQKILMEELRGLTVVPKNGRKSKRRQQQQTLGHEIPIDSKQYIRYCGKKRVNEISIESTTTMTTTTTTTTTAMTIYSYRMFYSNTLFTPDYTYSRRCAKIMERVKQLLLSPDDNSSDDSDNSEYPIRGFNFSVKFIDRKKHIENPFRRYYQMFQIIV